MRNPRRLAPWSVKGTTGEVAPANTIPYQASQNGATIIEINIKKSNYTDQITDIFLKGEAIEIMNKLKIFLKNRK